MNGISLP